jgi:NADH:flavin oxidoreductase / NADH oxidase family
MTMGTVTRPGMCTAAPGPSTMHDGPPTMTRALLFTPIQFARCDFTQQGGDLPDVPTLSRRRDGKRLAYRASRQVRPRRCGAGLCRGTAVERTGRMTHGDLSIWSDAHVEPLRRFSRHTARCRRCSSPVPAAKPVCNGLRTATARSMTATGRTAMSSTPYLSPISNKRTDRYGGSLDNRMRFGLEIANIVREG